MRAIAAAVVLALGAGGPALAQRAERPDVKIGDPVDVSCRCNLSNSPPSVEMSESQPEGNFSKRPMYAPTARLTSFTTVALVEAFV